jgi:hypothetical protein
MFAMREILMNWGAIILAVSVAAITNSVAALWAQNMNSFYFPLLLVLSPLVFITFGIVTISKGLSITSGVIDTLLVVTTVLIGLFFFGEWKKVTTIQVVGMSLACSGIFLMLKGGNS